jgi:hypothetical protein
MAARKTRKPAAARRTTRSKLGLTRGTVKDLTAETRRSRSVRGGAARRLYAEGNDQPPN